MVDPQILTARVAFQENVTAFGRDDEIDAAIDESGCSHELADFVANAGRQLDRFVFYVVGRYSPVDLGTITLLRQ